VQSEIWLLRATLEKSQQNDQHIKAMFPLDLLPSLCQHLASPADRMTLLSLQQTCYVAWEAASRIIYKNVKLRDNGDTASFFSVFRPSSPTRYDRADYICKHVQVVHFEYWNPRVIGQSIFDSHSLLSEARPTLFPNGIGIGFGQKALSSIMGIGAGGANRQTKKEWSWETLWEGLSLTPQSPKESWRDLHDATKLALNIVLIRLFSRGYEVCLEYPHSSDCPSPWPHYPNRVVKMSDARQPLRSALFQADISVINVHHARAGAGPSFAWPGSNVNIFLEEDTTAEDVVLSGSINHGIDVALICGDYKRESRWRINRSYDGGSSRAMEILRAHYFAEMDDGFYAAKTALLRAIGLDLVTFVGRDEMDPCRVCSCEFVISPRLSSDIQ